MTNFCVKIGSLKIIGLHHKKFSVKILPLPQHFPIEFGRNSKSILLRTGGGGGRAINEFIKNAEKEKMENMPIYTRSHNLTFSRHKWNIRIKKYLKNHEKPFR